MASKTKSSTKTSKKIDTLSGSAKRERKSNFLLGS